MRYLVLVCVTLFAMCLVTNWTRIAIAETKMRVEMFKDYSQRHTEKVRPRVENQPAADPKKL